MSITVNCNCGGRFRVGDQHAGKKIKCPKCAGAVQVPDETDEAAPEPVAVRQSTDAKKAKKGNTSKIAKAASSPVTPDRGTDRKVGPVHRGDTQRLDTSKIEVLSQKSITSRKEKGSTPAAAPADDSKKVIILSIVVVLLLIGSIAVGYKVMQEPAPGPNATPDNPSPTPQPVKPTPTPVNPPPVNPPPVDPTPLGPEPSVPTKPETLDGLVWPVQDFGGTLPEKARQGGAIRAQGSSTEETSGRTRTYDVEFTWEDSRIVAVDGWFEDRAGNRLTFKALTFCTSNDNSLIEAATAQGIYLREGSAKAGTIVISHANERGSLTITFRDGRVTEAVGMARTYTGEFQDVDQLRKEHLAVSTLLGILTDVATEVNDFGLVAAQPPK